MGVLKRILLRVMKFFWMALVENKHLLSRQFMVHIVYLPPITAKTVPKSKSDQWTSGRMIVRVTLLSCSFSATVIFTMNPTQKFPASSIADFKFLRVGSLMPYWLYHPGRCRPRRRVRVSLPSPSIMFLSPLTLSSQH